MASTPHASACNEGRTLVCCARAGKEVWSAHTSSRLMTFRATS